MAQTPIKLITTTELESLLQTHQSQERLLELVHGEVVEKMPTEIHGKLAALIAYFFLTFIRNGNIAAHVGVEVRHEASDDPYNSRIPDVSIRLTNQPPMISGAVPMFPDLAVEIQSPQDRPHHMREKALYYLQHGSHVIWLIYPQARRVEICSLRENHLVIRSIETGGILDAGNVLPGFSLALDELFADI